VSEKEPKDQCHLDKKQVCVDFGADLFHWKLAIKISKAPEQGRKEKSRPHNYFSQVL
jgi:hypothetical protein